MSLCDLWPVSGYFLQTSFRIANFSRSSPSNGRGGYRNESENIQPDADNAARPARMQRLGKPKEGELDVIGTFRKLMKGAADENRADQRLCSDCKLPIDSHERGTASSLDDGSRCYRCIRHLAIYQQPWPFRKFVPADAKVSALRIRLEF